MKLLQQVKVNPKMSSLTLQYLEFSDYSLI